MSKIHTLSIDQQSLAQPILLSGLYSLVFFIPFLFSGPQLLIGSVVNALLFLGARYLSLKQILPLLILPSLGAVLHSMLFASLTPFLLYFAPFIWLSNGILVFIFKYKAIPQGVVVASLFKASFLFLIASVFFKLELVPSLFLTAMGWVQLVTALIGGSIFLVINRYIAINKD